jgi:hypothetical protein
MSSRRTSSHNAVPPELAKLLVFQQGVQTFEGYSKGFWLTEDDKGG